VGFNTINAKAETVIASAMYREPFESRRCLVPASGFYEWMKLDPKTKQPYSIAPRDGSIIAFAGLWDRWKDKESGRVLDTYSIITTDPNELMKPENGPAIHDRMPVILARKDYDRWLTAPKGQPPIDLLRPFPAEELKAWKVKKEVGSLRNNSPDLCDEIWAEPSLFGNTEG
jgi:putative SOS response-associated peptidase YedK